MAEMSFCPYCDAAQHKLLLCKEDVFFCKQCNRFFMFKDINLKCNRCEGELRKSDFDSPSGGAVFLCSKCKKTSSIKELLEDMK